MPAPIPAAQPQPAPAPASAPTGPLLQVTTPIVAPVVSSVVRLTCTLSPLQSFNQPPGSETTAFVIDPIAACVNGRTLYERSSSGYTRVMRADATSVVTFLELSRDMATFRRRDFAFTPEQYANVTAAATRLGRSCSETSSAQLARVRQAALPFAAAAPMRQMTWTCASVR
jgi:hypothetical protein